MQAARHGIYKNHGMKSLIRETDRVRIQYAQRQAGPRIVIGATAARAQESSYEYEILLTPEEILRCLLTMSPASTPDALKKLAPQFNLGATLPDVVKQLVAGAIAAPKPPADDDDEDSEDDDEPDTDEA